MARILVISGDILPYPGFPTTGAGLRAWGLAKGLESRGHDVLLAMPRSSVANMPRVPKKAEHLLYENEELPIFILAHKPDVIVLQHWMLTTFLPESLEIPLVIDFHGPLLIEIQFQENPILERLKREKIQALHKADFFTCAGEQQKHYFFPWLMLAGFDLRQPIIDVIPVSLDPQLPQHDSQDETTFVYGGVFLPWQDPVSGLMTLVECLERKQHGMLKFFGGKHPVVTLPTAGFEQLIKRLQYSPRVKIQQTIPRDQLIREYCHAHVAFDLMHRNPERELAFTTRTVEYLWCGLPVIYNHYAELSKYIQAYQAGWTIDPNDQETIRRAIEEILDSPQVIAERGHNAQQLVRECLTWDKTIEPLDMFCRTPVKREKETPFLSSASRSIGKQLQYIQKKFLFHVKHEGIRKTLKRGWRKVKRISR
jgi:glycosyltransferase involved in cell wall biosynthesis